MSPFYVVITSSNGTCFIDMFIHRSGSPPDDIFIPQQEWFQISGTCNLNSSPFLASSIIPNPQLHFWHFLENSRLAQPMAQLRFYIYGKNAEQNSRVVGLYQVFYTLMNGT